MHPGRYTIAVKVIDIFGNDTMTLIRSERRREKVAGFARIQRGSGVAGFARIQIGAMLERLNSGESSYGKRR